MFLRTAGERKKEELAPAHDSGFSAQPFSVSLINKHNAKMDTQQQTNYDRIALAIGYLRQHFKSQPSLEEVAGIVQLSPHHFQRLFTEWAGTSPKRFLQYTSIAYAKGLLQGGQ